MVGGEVPILVEGLSEETDLLWQGRMPSQAPEIDGVTLINDFEGDEPRSGQIRTLRITEAHDYDLVGTLLPSEFVRDWRGASAAGRSDQHPTRLVRHSGASSCQDDLSDLQEAGCPDRSRLPVLQ